MMSQWYITYSFLRVTAVSVLLVVALLATVPQGTEGLLGACCSSTGSCSLTEPTSCTGRHLGELSLCGSVTCNGGCCCPAAKKCTVTTVTACKASNCTWIGAGTGCSGVSTCQEVGSCCISTATTADPLRMNCTVTTIGTCYNQLGGHRWTKGADCTVVGICPLLVPLFKDPLPIIPIAVPVAGNSGCTVNGSSDAIYGLTVSLFPNQFCSLFPNTIQIMSYNELPTPPIFSTCESARISVVFTNALPVDKHVSGETACLNAITPNVWSIHNHGAPSRSKFDGVMDNIKPSFSKLYYYVNPSGPRTFWYHDHGMSVGRNLAFGAAGVYVVESKSNLLLPSGAYDVPLVLADRQFYYDSANQVRLYYPARFATFGVFPNDEYVGTVAVVNNKVTPYMNVSPSLYRFRLLNGANLRIWTLSLIQISSGTITALQFYSIGGEQEFLPNPSSNLVSFITISNGERAQILIDFSQFKASTELYLINTAKVPYPNGDIDNVNAPIYAVMKFIVNTATATKATVPSSLPVLTPISVSNTSQYDKSFLLDQSAMSTDCDRSYSFVQLFKKYNTPSAGFYSTINDKSAAYENGLFFIEGSVAKLSFWNPSLDTHSIHIHAAEFTVIRVAKIGTTNPSSTSRTFLNITQEVQWQPEPHEKAIKDTIKILSGYMMELLVRFTGKAGFYFIHCHMLEHEDHIMSIFFYIKPASAPTAAVTFLDGSVCGNNICEAGNGENCNNCPNDCLKGTNYCCGYNNSAYSYNTQTKVITSSTRSQQTNSSSFIACSPTLCRQQNIPYYYTTFCTTDYIISYCGDSWCEAAETSSNCPQDCKPTIPDFTIEYSQG